MATGECVEHIGNITEGKQPFMLLFYLNPVDTQIWTARSNAWIYSFITYSAVFSVLFLTVGIISVILAIRRNCHRLKTKTFIAIYSCLAIFGFSRMLFLAVDPNGVIGWLVQYFPQWSIITRFFAVLGFPSFSAAYILVFMTLYKSTDISSSRLWAQDWRVITAIIATTYSLALGAEVLANTAAYPALLSSVVCEAAFSLWGIITGIIFIFAGCRLLVNLKEQCSKSVRMSASFGNEKARKLRKKQRAQSSDDIFYDENYQRRYKRIAKTVRKITIITFFSATIGTVYAMINLVALFFTCWLMFVQCMGLNGQADSTMWLSLRVTTSTIEVPLVLIILYSVTDFSVLTRDMCCYKKAWSRTAHYSPPVSSAPSRSSSETFYLGVSTSPLPSMTIYPPPPNVPPPPLPSHMIIDIHSSLSGSLDEQV